MRASGAWHVCEIEEPVQDVWVINNEPAVLAVARAPTHATPRHRNGAKAIYRRNVTGHLNRTESMFPDRIPPLPQISADIIVVVGAIGDSPWGKQNSHLWHQTWRG